MYRMKEHNSKWHNFFPFWSSQLSFRIWGFQRRHFFLFLKWIKNIYFSSRNFIFNLSSIELSGTLFRKKVEKKTKIWFWRFGSSPGLPWRFLCLKTPEMNVSDPYLISKKIPNLFCCLTAEKSSMEAGDSSPADHHNILNCKVATQTMVGITRNLQFSVMRRSRLSYTVCF